MVTSPARDVAFSALRAVDDEQAYSNLVVPALLRQRHLNSADAAFATELVQGTLRRRGTYDAVINALNRHGVEGLQAPVLDVLRIGMHQLLTLRVPSHAAVSTSVSLVRARVGHKPAGLVNAILRRAAEYSLEEWVSRLTSTMDPTEAIAVRHSHPEWIVRALREALHHDENQLTALLERNNEAPPVTLVARPGLCEPADLPGVPGSISPYAMRLTSGDPAQVSAVRDGRAGVQDEGSQAVVHALVQARAGNGKPVIAPSERWLDLCAGPGGKAALMGAIAAREGADLVANEVQPHRAQLLRQTLRMLPHVSVAEHDGREGPWQPGAFDRVLLDAPCTGLGAIRRRPESRWRRTPADLESLVPLQQELLARAVQVTRAGGIIGYVTCSPHLAETTHVVHSAAGVDVEAELRWWPHLHDTDAMYLALLRRRETARLGY